MNFCRRIRWNVLILVGAGYVAVLAIFLMLVVDEKGMDAAGAYEVVKGPLMALIGGSLALAKDLLREDELPDSPNLVDDLKNKRSDQNHEKPEKD